MPPRQIASVHHRLGQERNARDCEKCQMPVSTVEHSRFCEDWAALVCSFCKTKRKVFFKAASVKMMRRHITSDTHLRETRDVCKGCQAEMTKASLRRHRMKCAAYLELKAAE